MFPINIQIMKKNRYIYCIILLLISCSDNIDENITTVKIEFDKKDIISTIQSDSIFESVKYVPLETTADNIISAIERVKLYGDEIFIFDKTQHIIFIFDKCGTYKYKLDKRGKSNTEYLRINDFNVDENNIYIMDASKRQIIVYNKFDLSFVRRISLDTNYSSFSFAGDNILLFADFSSFTSDRFNLALLNKINGKIESRFKPFPKSQLGIGSSSYPFFSTDSVIYATFRYEYSIYKIIDNKVSKIVNVDMGEENMYNEELRVASSDERNSYKQQFDPTSWPISEIQDIIVHNSNYIFSFIFRTLTYTCFYNSETGNYKCGVVSGTDKFPFSSQQFCDYHDGEIIQSMNCNHVNQIIKNRGIISSISENLKKLDDFGNPVLMFYKLK